jgi:hypothetical protein
MPSLLLIQWGIVSIFVLIHFLLGFARGTSKSAYYTIVSIFLTVVTIGLVSFLTIRWFFTPESLLAYVQGLTGGAIPADFEQFFLDPNLSGIVFALIDLVLKIIAFFILYPIVKWILTFVIFRTMWQRGFLQSLLARQDEKKVKKMHRLKPSEQSVLLPSRRLHVSLVSRLFGGAFGAVRGLLVAFIFLLPLLVLASFTQVMDPNAELRTVDGVFTINIGDREIDVERSEYQRLLDSIQELNEKGLLSYSQQLKVGTKTVDRLIFDMVFTTRVVDGSNQVTRMNFGDEFEGIMGIAAVLLEGGYLDSTFDVNDLSKDNLDDLELIFGYLGQSKLISYMIPVAVRYGVENLLPDVIGVNLYDRNRSAAALYEFENIDWEEEFGRIFDVLAAVLEFKSVGELLELLEDTDLLFQLSPEEGRALADIVRALGNMKTMTLLNVALDYATTLTEIQEFISWMSPAEAEAYLSEKLDFAISDLDFFVGNDGEIARIAALIEAVFADGDADLVNFFNNLGDPDVLLDPQYGDWIGNIVEKLVEIQLVIEAIPIGVDYALYGILSDELEAEFADRLVEALENIDWGDEITNVADIYKEALKLGLSGIFGDDPAMFDLIDAIASDNIETIKTIVDKIFEGSQAVNKVLEIVTPYVIDRFITDDDALKDLVMDVVGDPVDFNFGQEFKTILDIVGSIYDFTTISELATVGDLETEELVEFLAKFGGYVTTRF